MAIICIAQMTSSSKLNIQLLSQQHQFSKGHTSLQYKRETNQAKAKRRLSTSTVLGTGTMQFCHSRKDLLWFIQKTTLIDKPRNVFVEG